MTRIIAPTLKSIRPRQHVAARARQDASGRVRKNPAPLVDVNEMHLSSDPAALTEDLQLIFESFLRLFRDQERIAQFTIEQRRESDVIARWSNNAILMLQLVIIAGTLLRTVGNGAELTPQQFWDVATEQVDRDTRGATFRSFMQDMRPALYGKHQFNNTAQWVEHARGAGPPGAVFEAMLTLRDATDHSLSVYSESADKQWGDMLYAAIKADWDFEKADVAAILVISSMNQAVGIRQRARGDLNWNLDRAMLISSFMNLHGRGLISPPEEAVFEEVMLSMKSGE